MMIYALKVTLFWLVSYLFFIAFMKKETYFKTNRIFLISTLCFGLFVPFINLNFLVTPELFTAQLPTVVIGDIVMNELGESIESKLNIVSIFIGVMVVVGLVYLFKLIRGIYQISNLIKKGDCQNYEKYTLVNLKQISSPMSFLNYLFWNPSIPLESEDGRKIFLHEYTHIVQKHSYDLFFIELLKLVFWWNPMIYLYKKAIQDVHEYLADEAVVVQSNRQQYGHMLIEQTMSYINGNNVMLANYFFHSQLKKRIEMLIKKKSDKQVILRYYLFLPILIMLIFACSTNNEIDAQVNQEVDKIISPKVVGEIIDTIIVFDADTWEETISIVKSNTYDIVDKMPLFKGCDDNLEGKELQICAMNKLMMFIADSLNYPEDAKKAGIEGMVVVEFTIHYDKGDIMDAKIVKSLGDEFDKEVVRVVQSMPAWHSGEHNGKRVNVQLKLPIKFKL